MLKKARSLMAFGSIFYALVIMVSCAAPQIQVMDIEKETAANEVLRKDIQSLPLPEVFEERPISIVITQDGIDYVAYDVPNHNLVKAKLAEGKRYREYADESIGQLGLANRKNGDLVDIMNIMTHSTYTLQKGYNQCQGELYKEKILGGLYQIIGIGGLLYGIGK